MGRALLIVLAGAVVTAALLTPVVCSLLVVPGIFPPWPFSRVFDRVILLTAIIWLLLYRKSLSLSAFRSYFSAGSWRDRGRLLGIGCAITLFFGLAAFPLVSFSDTVQISLRSPEYYLFKILRVLPAALLISVLEESFFRLFFFGSLRKKLSFIWAALLSSSIYSFVHFIKPVKTFSYHQFEWTAGFVYLQTVFDALLGPQLIMPFIGLSLVGLVLCYTLEKVGALYLCIGLHTGWVVIEKLSKHALAPAPGVLETEFGSRFFLVGYPALWLSVALVFGVLYCLFRKRSFLRLCPAQRQPK